MIKKFINSFKSYIDEPHEKIIFITIFLILFGFIHYAISEFQPNSYNTKLTLLDAIYFSSTSIFTLGFGEYYPTSSLSRLITIIQAYVFVIIAFVN